MPTFRILEIANLIVKLDMHVFFTCRSLCDLYVLLYRMAHLAYIRFTSNFSNFHIE